MAAGVDSLLKLLQGPFVLFPCPGRWRPEPPSHLDLPHVSFKGHSHLFFLQKASGAEPSWTNSSFLHATYTVCLALPLNFIKLLEDRKHVALVWNSAWSLDVQLYSFDKSFFFTFKKCQCLQCLQKSPAYLTWYRSPTLFEWMNEWNRLWMVLVGQDICCTLGNKV